MDNNELALRKIYSDMPETKLREVHGCGKEGFLPGVWEIIVEEFNKRGLKDVYIEGSQVEGPRGDNGALNIDRLRKYQQVYAGLGDQQILRALESGESAFEPEAWESLIEEAKKRNLKATGASSSGPQKSIHEPSARKNRLPILNAQYFESSGWLGLWRALEINILTAILAWLLGLANTGVATLVWFGINLLIGVQLINKKRFPIYYIVSVLFFWGFAILVMFIMSSRAVKHAEGKPRIS